jgi:hypothetical protein
MLHFFFYLISSIIKLRFYCYLCVRHLVVYYLVLHATPPAAPCERRLLGHSSSRWRALLVPPSSSSQSCSNDYDQQIRTMAARSICSDVLPSIVHSCTASKLKAPVGHGIQPPCPLCMKPIWCHASCCARCLILCENGERYDKVREKRRSKTN